MLIGHVLCCSSIPVEQTVLCGTSNAEIMGSSSRECMKLMKCVPWMQCKSLWIKTPAKCIYVIYYLMVRSTTVYILNKHWIIFSIILFQSAAEQNTPYTFFTNSYIQISVCPMLEKLIRVSTLSECLRSIDLINQKHNFCYNFFDVCSGGVRCWACVVRKCLNGCFWGLLRGQWRSGREPDS